jgi:hypothetical protein
MAGTPVDPALIGAVVVVEPADEPAAGAPARPDVIVDRASTPSVEAQEILFVPQGRPDTAPPLRLFFETGAADLDRQLAAVAESVYVLGGMRDVDEFGNAMRGTFMQAPGDPWMAPTFPVPVQGEPYYLDAERTPKRHALVSGYDEVKRTLLERAVRAVEEFQPAAVEWARALVTEHRALVVDQAYRYLSLVGETDPEKRLRAVTDSLQSSPSGIGISGPESAELVGALRAVKTPREGLESIETNSRDRTIARVVRTASGLAKVNPSALLALPFLSFQTPEEQRAEVDVRVAIAAEIERIAAPHQIVHRLWSTAAVDRVTDIAMENPRFDDDQIARSLSMDIRYRQAVGGALADTLNACTGMLAALRTGEHVWRYPRALEGALEDRGVPRASLTATAVRERAARVAGERSVISSVNEVVGYCELIALAGGVTAPTAALLEVASIALGVLEAAETTWHTWLQTQASRTHLNPGLALASEPSYVGILLAILGASAAAGLGVRGLRR